jgi:hypothetical protein
MRVIEFLNISWNSALNFLFGNQLAILVESFNSHIVIGLICRKIRKNLVISQEKQRIIAIFTKKMLFFIDIPQKIINFAQNAIIYETGKRRHQPAQSCSCRAEEDQQVAGRAVRERPGNSE